MIRALAASVSSLNAQQLKVDTVANNLANVNTAGYKKDRAYFSELAGQEMNSYGIPVTPDPQDRAKCKVGSGVRVSAVVKNFKPGDLINTERPLDLAICGEGFFKVVLPDGGERYTRDGCFSLNQDGNLVTPSGYTLEGIQMPPDSDGVVITQNGTVLTEEEGNPVEAGQIQLYRFTSMAVLKPEGENLYSVSSGEPQAGVPGSDGFGAIRQGCLETSNVDLIEEMANLIEAQRAYGFSARVIRTADEMWGLANNLRK